MVGHTARGNVITVYAGEEAPQGWSGSVFLAGPTPRTPDVPTWRPAALEEIERRWDRPGRLAVFLPEPRDGAVWPDYDRQRSWELYWGDRCDEVLFWIPRGPGMPALTTNDEFGRWKDTGRVVLGTPPGAERVRYQRDYATDNHIPLADTLADTVTAALDRIGDGAWRSCGQRHVPLLLWRTSSFRSWLGAQQGAGNELRAGRLEWTFRTGERRQIVVFWAFHAQVYVAAENRVKGNEVVISRPDISTVLAYRRAPDLADTEIVLVKEFRSPSVAADGFVRELPGGSSLVETSPIQLAAAELAEETRLQVAVERFRTHQVRQLAATFSAHRQHLFSVELTAREVDQVRQTVDVLGNADDSELTYPEVRRLGDLVATSQVDWTTLGALTEVLLS